MYFSSFQLETQEHHYNCKPSSAFELLSGDARSAFSFGKVRLMNAHAETPETSQT